MTNLYSNPHWEPEWDYARNAGFVEANRRWLQEVTTSRYDYGLWHSNPYHPRKLIYEGISKKEAYSILYHHARVHRAFCGSYDELVAAMAHGHYNWKTIYRGKWAWSCRRRDSRFWYEIRGVEFRERMAYRRKPHHRKKEKSCEPDYKTDWREKKLRDRRKKSYRGRKTWAKKLSNQSHRAWERQCIEREAWDDLWQGSAKWFSDSWMWD